MSVSKAQQSLKYHLLQRFQRLKTSISVSKVRNQFEKNTEIFYCYNFANNSFRIIICKQKYNNEKFLYN